MNFRRPETPVLCEFVLQRNCCCPGVTFTGDAFLRGCVLTALRGKSGKTGRDNSSFCRDALPGDCPKDRSSDHSKCCEGASSGQQISLEPPAPYAACLLIFLGFCLFLPPCHVVSPPYFNNSIAQDIWFFYTEFDDIRSNMIPSLFRTRKPPAQNAHRAGTRRKSRRRTTPQ